MTTQPDNEPVEYPDSWKRPVDRDTRPDGIDEYIAGLSAAGLQALLKRTRGGDR